MPTIPAPSPAEMPIPAATMSTDETQTVQREVKAKQDVPVPPDAFTLFCQATIAKNHPAIARLRIHGKQQDINKELARLWANVIDTDATDEEEEDEDDQDGPPIIFGIEASEKEDLLQQSRLLMATYHLRKSLFPDFTQLLETRAFLETFGSSCGWHFFCASSERVLRATLSNTLLWYIWNAMPREEKAIYQSRARRIVELEIALIGYGAPETVVAAALASDEFYSFLPMSTYARVGTRAREYWGV